MCIRDRWDNDVEDGAGGGDDDNLLRGVCAGDGVIIAVGGAGNGRALRSIDGGATWTVSELGSGWLGGCAFGVVGDDRVFAAIGSGRAIRSVDGGLTWIDPEAHREGGRNWEMRDVAFLHGRFVAVGDTGTSTSVDGTGFSAPTGPPNLFRVAAGNGVWVAVGSGLRARSVDGITWTDEPTGGRDVAFAGDHFVMAGAGQLFFSPDGQEWESRGGPTFERLVAGEVLGQTVYIGTLWPDARRRSTDGTNWDEVARDGGNAIDDLVFVPGPSD